MIFRRMSHDNNKWAVNQLPLSFARDSQPPGGATSNYNSVLLLPNHTEKTILRTNAIGNFS